LSNASNKQIKSDLAKRSSTRHITGTRSLNAVYGSQPLRVGPLKSFRYTLPEILSYGGTEATRRQRHLGELGPWTEQTGALQLDHSTGSIEPMNRVHLKSDWNPPRFSLPSLPHPLKCRAAEVGRPLLDKISSRNPKLKQVRIPRNPPSCYVHVHAPIYQTCSLDNSLDFRRLPRSSSITVLFAQIADCR
jgi:hypothetical protein